MRSHAKASTAGSDQRQAKGGRVLSGVDGFALLSGLGAPVSRARRLVLVVAALTLACALVPVSAEASAPTLGATWSEDVTVSEAILKAEINPEGATTTYHFEYGKTEAYGSATPEITVGADSSPHTVGRFLQGLQAGAAYHYRVVATNVDAVSKGPDRTFTTFEAFVPETACPNQAFRVGPSLNLPDCRAYEMVSPIDKNGADIKSLGTGQAGDERGAVNRSSVNGGKFTYSSSNAFGDAPANYWVNQYMATRGPDGWVNHGISPPRGVKTIPTIAFPYSSFRGFTPDLSIGWVLDNNAVPLTPDAAQGFIDLYQRDGDSGAYKALTTSQPTIADPHVDLEFKGNSSDATQTVFEAKAALTPDAANNTNKQIYDYGNGELHLVSVLPDGTANLQRSTVGSSAAFNRTGERVATSYHAVSSDGSHIFWTSETGSQRGVIYVRLNPVEEQSALNGSGECTEPTRACTLPVSSTVTTNPALFWTASVDGSRAVFSTDPDESGPLMEDLYMYDVDNGTSTLIAHEAVGVAGASNDLSRIYFISNDALAPGAVAGEGNLYLYEEGNTTFIATLAPVDVGGVSIIPDAPSLDSRYPISRDSRITPNGGSIAFMSSRSLTGYDNTDVVDAGPLSVNGDADLEVFVYNADSHKLICASCRPSGARPKGQLLVNPYRSSREITWGQPGGFTVLDAAWIPTWEWELYAARALSDDGRRLFFNSFDALVPQDTNGVQDVYEWEAQGEGNCHDANGCISLLSNGKSTLNSEFVDATPDGSDVFIETASSLDPEDPGLIDIYDARVDGGFPPPPPSPPECAGDSCQSPSPAPNDPTPASASFRGEANPRPRKDCSAQARRGARLAREAKRMRRIARRSPGDSAARRRAGHLAKQAARLSRTAARCRRANRGAGR